MRVRRLPEFLILHSQSLPPRADNEQVASNMVIARLIWK